MFVRFAFVWLALAVAVVELLLRAAHLAQPVVVVLAGVLRS